MNRVALITGASRGIGRGIALELAESGFDLGINYAGNEDAARSTAEAVIEAAQEKGKTIRSTIVQGDVGNDADRKRMMEHIRSEFGRIDLLVNNAIHSRSVV